jgi:hypothetical protein
MNLDINNKPTMNLDIHDKTSEKRFARSILHEFGHALGMVHEHQSPKSGIPWDEEKAYNHYQNQCKWDRETVDSEVLRRYDEDQTNSSEFDPDSIMTYEVPSYITMNGSSIRGNNCKLSERDKSFIAELYPKFARMATAIPRLSTEPILTGQKYKITNVKYKNLASLEGSLHKKTLTAKYEQDIAAEQVSRMSLRLSCD